MFYEISSMAELVVAKYIFAQIKAHQTILWNLKDLEIETN